LQGVSGNAAHRPTALVLRRPEGASKDAPVCAAVDPTRRRVASPAGRARNIDPARSFSGVPSSGLRPPSPARGEGPHPDRGAGLL